MADHRDGNGMGWQQKLTDYWRPHQDIVGVSKKSLLYSNDEPNIAKTCTASTWIDFRNLQNNQTKTSEFAYLPALRKEVKERHAVWREWNFDNILAELLKQGGIETTLFYVNQAHLCTTVSSRSWHVSVYGGVRRCVSREQKGDNHPDLGNIFTPSLEKSAFQ